MGGALPLGAPRSRLTHNLFEESGQDADLRASGGRRPVRLLRSLRYWGRAHRFYTTRLSDTPLTAVAFRKEDLLRGVNVQVLEGALALVLLYTAVICALPSLLYVAIVATRVGWLVPSAAQGPVYACWRPPARVVFVLLSTRLRPANATERGCRSDFAAPGRRVGLAAAAFRLRLSCRLGGLLGPERRSRAAAWLSQRYRVGHVVAALLFWALLAVFLASRSRRRPPSASWQASSELAAGRHEARSSGFASGRRRSCGQSLTGETPRPAGPGRTSWTALRKRSRRGSTSTRRGYGRRGSAASPQERGVLGHRGSATRQRDALCAARSSVPLFQPGSRLGRAALLSPRSRSCVRRAACPGSGLGLGGRLGPWPTF